MNVLFVLENYLPHIGGAEIVFKNLAESLVKRGFHVDLVTHRLKNTKQFEVINGVRVHRVRCFDSRYLFTFFSILKVLHLAKKADIIHTTTFNGAPPAWLASRLRRKKCVITVHEVWINRWRKLTDKNWLVAFTHNFLEKMIYSLPFDKYVCVSKSTQRDLVSLGIHSNKTDVIYNGIDYKHFNPQKYDKNEVRKKLRVNGKFVYLYYGRPGPSKGVEYLIRAMKEVVTKMPESKLILILSKDTAYRKRYESIKKLIKRIGMAENVLVQDPVPWGDLPGYILAADCVVVPSLAEGFGFSAVESCAMGKKVVVTSAGSLPEVVSGRFVIVEPKNVQSLTQGMFDVYNGNVEKTNLKTFNVERNVNQYMETYLTMIK